jgi:two-component sensor histidine kinase
MQNDASSDSAVHETLEKLENRVNAISKTYSMLLTNDAIQEIDMKRYIDELLKDLMDSMEDREHKQIEISSSIHAKLPLKRAVYVGLIINELLTNAYKHAFPTGRGKVSLYLNEEKGEYLLKFNDNGIGYDTKTSTNSFGLKLINIIVKHQLKGSIIVETQPHCEYTIRFSL